MLETARYEARRRARGTAVIAVGLSLYTAFIIYYYSVLEDVDYEAIFEDMPPVMRDAFGIQALGTIEGFLGVQIYNFVWLLGLGLYFAYAAGGLIASDIEHGRLDLLISLPVSRSRILLEKFASLLLPLLTLNVVVGIVVYGLVVTIGETIDPVNLLVVHVMSIPYLLTCAAIGLVFSVVVNRAAIAERAAIGVVFVLYLLDSVVSDGSSVEWVQYVSPTTYFEPTPLLVDGSYALLDTAVLAVLFVVLLLASRSLFQRRDL